MQNSNNDGENRGGLFAFPFSFIKVQRELSIPEHTHQLKHTSANSLNEEINADISTVVLKSIIKKEEGELESWKLVLMALSFLSKLWTFGDCRGLMAGLGVKLPTCLFVSVFLYSDDRDRNLKILLERKIIIASEKQTQSLYFRISSILWNPNFWRKLIFYLPIHFKGVTV